MRHNLIDGLEYVWIPPGSYMMGCVPGDRGCFSDEAPRHEVTISKGFWIGRTEVTVAAYERFVRAIGAPMPPVPNFNPEWREKDHPINNVIWDEANAYCEWAGGRLPTEAEWEYAARGGKDGLKYPAGNRMNHDDTNYEGTRGKDQWKYTAPVGSFDPNGWGLFETAGNVWEWTADWHLKDYYARSPSTDPRGPASGQHRVVRGGAWITRSTAHLRTSSRVSQETNRRYRSIGMRCVR